MSALGRVAAVSAILPLVLGSRLFLASAKDPLMFTDRELEAAERPAAVLRQERLDGHATHLRLSPGGTRYAVRRVEHGSPALDVFVVGDFSGGRIEIGAADLAFLDERRAVALVGGGPAAGAMEDGEEKVRELELRTYELVNPPRLVSTKRLRRLDTAQLAIDAKGASYRVTGIDFKTGELVRLAGALEGDRVAETRWKGPATKTSVPLSAWAVGDGDTALDVERKFETRPAVYRTDDEVSPWHSEIWALRSKGNGRLGSTSLSIRCLQRPAGAASTAAARPFTCLSVTPDATYFWSADADRGALLPLASVRGRALQEAIARDGRVAAWLGERGLVVLDPKTSTAVRLKLPVEKGWGVSLEFADSALGILLQDGAGTAVIVVQDR